MKYPVITLKEAKKILGAREDKISLSLDLGLTSQEIKIKEGIANLGNFKIPIEEFKKAKEETCYIVDEDKILKQIAFFSIEANLFYKLHPTSDWPTIKISSVPMHRHIKVMPKEDTELKIKEVFPVKGIVLDTCCGLGYTAIMASKFAEKVHTFERDENVLRIASFNPHSEKLFNNPKIELHKESIFDAIKKFPDNYFDRIIHDPPTFKISPELYKIEFHQQLLRVLKTKGIIYHYCPNPGKTKGAHFYIKIVKQLIEIGFKKVEYHEWSSGIGALKY
jgi:uncharacterized protein